MSESNSTRTGGIGFTGLLAILFIGLKLGGVIDWSWWWVLSPLWIPLSLVLLILIGWIAVELIRSARRPGRRYRRIQ